MLLADAPIVEGLVAAAVAAQGGASVHAVKRAAEATHGYPASRPKDEEHVSSAAHVAAGPSARSGGVTRAPQSGVPAGPDASGDFELVNLAGMHARPAAKIAGGLAGARRRGDGERRRRRLHDGADDTGGRQGLGAPRGSVRTGRGTRRGVCGGPGTRRVSESPETGTSPATARQPADQRRNLADRYPSDPGGGRSRPAPPKRRQTARTARRTGSRPSE